jgi:hypothetical protein
MKPSMVTKLLLLLLCGAAFGAHIAADHEKWNRLGRDTFISYQSHRFDLYMSHPAPAFGLVIGTALFLAGFGTIYELAGYVTDRLFSKRKNLVKTPDPASIS